MAFSNQEVFFKKETAWGTGVDPTQPTTTQLEVLGKTQNFSFKVENSANITNNASSPYPLYRTMGNVAITGTYDFEYVNAMPFALMLGTVTASDPVEQTAPYAWNITPTASIPSFTASILGVGTNEVNTQLTGCYATSLSFRLGLTGGASGTLNFIAKDKNDDAFTAPTTITLPTAEQIESIGTAIDIGDLTDVSYITEIDFTISRDSKINYSLSSRTGTQNVLGKYGAITGNITAWVEDSATARELEDIVTGDTGAIGDCLTEQDIVIDWLPSCNTAPATDDEVVITIKDAILKSAEMRFPLNDGIAYTIPFIAKYISKVEWDAPATVASGGW